MAILKTRLNNEGGLHFRVFAGLTSIIRKSKSRVYLLIDNEVVEISNSYFKLLPHLPNRKEFTLQIVGDDELFISEKIDHYFKNIMIKGSDLR